MLLYDLGDAAQRGANEIGAWIPNLVGALAALARRLLGDTSLGGIVAVVAPILVMTIAAFMILDELQVARTIVTITYAGLVGALALGSALAFGLGGRDVAARLLEGAYAAGEA